VARPAIEPLRRREGTVEDMLRDIDATALLAVKDVDVARKFYEGTLGLEPSGSDNEGMARYTSGTTPILLYESEFAGTNQANALAWTVGDEFESLVDELRARGVTFEHYDLPGLTLEGDVHVADDFKAVWFKDPDGNILHVNKAPGGS
jgi:catechol 2,3-dioxygenase-like lactoylglutathione lyase family enzyme